MARGGAVIQQFPVITFALKFINCFITSNYINRDHRELPFFREKKYAAIPGQPDLNLYII